VSRRRIQPPRGPWDTILQLLGSANAPVFLGLWIALAAITGLVSEPGMHPMEHLGLRLPLVMLPFCLLARGLRRGGRGFGVAAMWTTGLVLVLLGSWQPEGTGVAEVSPQASTELYQRAFRGRYVASHLGGTMTVEESDVAVTLRLGLPGQPPEVAVLPKGGDGEVALGPWMVHLRGRSAGEGPLRRAVLEFTPRAGGAPIRVTAAVGVSIPVAAPDTPLAAAKSGPDQVVVRRLLEDFRKSMGPAAQLEVSWRDGRETAWHFIDAPDLDSRHGGAPWKIKLVAVESPPARRIGVRRTSGPIGAEWGWGLMALALVAGVFVTREAP